MQPGPTLIISCPKCNRLFKRETLMSGNTLGARRLDGRGIFGHSEEEAPEEWHESEHVRELAGEEYLEALSVGLGDSRERERHLRVKAWWRANDRYRNPEVDPVAAEEDPAFTPDLVDSLFILYEQIRLDDPDARLIKAELARELGNFSGAIRVLEYNFPEEGHRQVAELIRRLSARGIRTVQEITTPTN